MDPDANPPHDDDDDVVIDAEFVDDEPDEDEPEGEGERRHRMPMRALGEDGYELPDPDERRCNAKLGGSLDENGENGIRCRRWKIRGGKRCKKHGGARNPALNEQRIARQEWETMRSGHDAYWYPDVTWEAALQAELNRTQWEIVRLETKIRQLRGWPSKDDPLGGETEMLVTMKEEKSGGGPTGDYTLVRREARESVYVQAWREERKHLATIVKIASTAGLGREYIEVMKAYARELGSAMIEMAAQLGHDADSPEVKQLASLYLSRMDERIAIANSPQKTA